MNEIYNLNEELKTYLENTGKYCEVRNDQNRKPEDYVIHNIDETSSEECIPVVLFNLNSQIESNIDQKPGLVSRELITFQIHIIDKNDSPIKNLIQDIMKFKSNYFHNISVKNYNVKPHPNSPELYKIISLKVNGILHCTY